MTRKWTFSGTAELTRNPSEVRVHQQCLLHCLVTSHDTRNHLKVAQTIKAKDMYPERSCVLEGSVIQVPVVYTLDGEANALILHDIGEEHTDLIGFFRKSAKSKDTAGFVGGTLVEPLTTLNLWRQHNVEAFETAFSKYVYTRPSVE